jgi:hypothetical protein
MGPLLDVRNRDRILGEVRDMPERSRNRQTQQRQKYCAL